jgi:hypothetical protein
MKDLSSYPHFCISEKSPLWMPGLESNLGPFVWQAGAPTIRISFHSLFIRQATPRLELRDSQTNIASYWRAKIKRQKIFRRQTAYGAQFLYSYHFVQRKYIMPLIMALGPMHCMQWFSVGMTYLHSKGISYTGGGVSYALYISLLISKLCFTNSPPLGEGENKGIILCISLI